MAFEEDSGGDEPPLVPASGDVGMESDESSHSGRDERSAALIPPPPPERPPSEEAPAAEASDAAQATSPTEGAEPSGPTTAAGTSGDGAVTSGTPGGADATSAGASRSEPAGESGTAPTEEPRGDSGAEPSGEPDAERADGSDAERVAEADAERSGEPDAERADGSDTERVAEADAEPATDTDAGSMGGSLAGSAGDAPSRDPAAPPEASQSPVHLGLRLLDDDGAFLVRDVGDVSLLATDLARLGQLFPIDVVPRPEGRFRVVCGHRRVAALRFLQRDRVLARVHAGLSDNDALLMAVASVVHSAPATPEDLRALRDRLDSERRMSPALADLLSKAQTGLEELAPEAFEASDERAVERAVEPDGARAAELGVPRPVAREVGGVAARAPDGPNPEGQGEDEEVDADELAAMAAERLGEINQDLALLADVFSSLEPDRREELLTQLKYSSALVDFLEGSS